MPSTLLSRGGLYNAHERKLPASRWDFLPNGARVKGANIMPPPRAGELDGRRRLGDQWARWSDASHPGGWLNIKAQIDQAKALGCNLVRVFATQNARAGSGGPYLTSDVAVSDAAYFAAWEQMLNYCRSVGVYCYPCLGGQDSGMIDGGNGWLYTPTLAWQAAESAKIAGWLDRHIDIVPGVDLGNEALTWANTVENGKTRGLQVYEAVKAVAPRLPLTWSHAIFAAPGPTPPQPAGAWDFLDLHIYYDAAATDLDAMLGTASQALVVGEFGSPRSAGAARVSRYQSALNVVNNVGSAGTGFRKVAGAMVWTLRDAGPGDPSDQTIQWGLASIDGSTVYSDVASIWASLPTT